VQPERILKLAGLHFALGVVALFAGGYILYMTVVDRPPSEAALEQVAGHISQVTSLGNEVLFRLKNDDRTFAYPSKAGQMLEVREALKTSQQVSIKFDGRRARAPLFGMLKTESRYDVWEIRVGESVVREYREVAQAKKEDDALSFVIVPFLLGSGIYLIFRSSRLRQAGSAAQSVLPRHVEAEASPDDPIAQAEVYVHYGRNAAAIAVLQERLRSHPTDERAKAKLAEIQGQSTR
jgi:hypothetical protein